MDKKKNSLGTAGGVVGIVNISLSLFLSWIFPMLFIILSVISIALSAVGLKKANAEGLPRGLAITGLATSIPTLLWNLLWTSALVSAFAS